MEFLALFHNIFQLDNFKGSDFKYDMEDFLSFKIEFIIIKVIRFQ